MHRSNPENALGVEIGAPLHAPPPPHRAHPHSDSKCTGVRKWPNFACSPCFPPKRRKPTGPRGAEILLSLRLKPAPLAGRGIGPSPRVRVCQRPCQGQEPGQPTRVAMRLCLSVDSANRAFVPLTWTPQTTLHHPLVGEGLRPLSLLQKSQSF